MPSPGFLLDLYDERKAARLLPATFGCPRTMTHHEAGPGRQWGVAWAAVLWSACCLCPASHPTSPAGTGVSASSGPLSVGAGSVEITLPDGTALAGYGDAPRRVIDAPHILLALGALGPGCVDPTPTTAAVFFEPATGTRDPLRARALVVSNGSRKLAFVKFDAIGMSSRLRKDLVAAAAPLGIHSDGLVALASHTHSGPAGVSDEPLWEIAASDCFSPADYQAVESAGVAALTQANAALQPAQLAVGSVTVTGANRNRRNQPSIVDQELGLLKVTTNAGAPLAALFNFAVHGTALSASNMQFSADCLGAMEVEVESQLPGVVAIFTNGAEGDVAPEKTGAAGIQTEGQIVGDAVAALWPTIPTTASGDLRAVLREVTMPAAQYNPLGCLPLAGSSATLCDIVGSPLTLPLDPSWLSSSLPFQAVRINDTVFVMMPGELVTELGWELKSYAATSGFAHGFVLGLANDHGGYFTTAAQYQAATYEGQSTLYGPNTGSFVVSQGKTAIDQVK